MATNGVSNFLSALSDLTSSAFQKTAPAVSTLASNVKDAAAAAFRGISNGVANGVRVLNAFTKTKPNLVVIEISNEILNPEEGVSFQAKKEQEINVSDEGEVKSEYVELSAPSETMLQSEPI